VIFEYRIDQQARADHDAQDQEDRMATPAELVSRKARCEGDQAAEHEGRRDPRRGPIQHGPRQFMCERPVIR
jgi:hypothetical protein